MAALRIVLVEPREAGNIGAVARAMKNFGFGELWIVGHHPELLPVSGWWASGADDVLAAARFTNTLEEAIGDAHVTVATTSMRGRTTPVTFTPRTLAAKFASLAEHQILALVFGREDHGLTREEVVLCQYSAAVPANAVFPTMNLAQSACVFCYELGSVHSEGFSQQRLQGGNLIARELPDSATIERLHQNARALLLEIGFLFEENPDHIYDELRAMVARASLDPREATIVLGIIRQIAWKVRRSSDAPDPHNPQ